MPVRTIGSQKHKVRRRQAGAAVALVAVGTVGGLLIADAVASGSSAYITAVATTAGVSQTLPVTGVVEPVSNVQADFQVAGTVSAVNVSMGQQVTAGQELATIGASSLQLTVSNDQATLTAAEAKLTADEENQAGTGSSGPGASSANSAATASAIESSNPGIVLAVATFSGSQGHSGSSGSLAADQQAVVAGQHTVDLDIQASNAAFRQAQMTCSAVTTGSGSSTSSSTSTPPTSTSATSTSTASPPTTSSSAVASPSQSPPTSTAGSGSPGGTGASAACVAALGNAEQAAAKANSAEQALASAESTLAQLLSKEAAASPSKGAGSSTGSPSGHSSIGSGASGSGTSRSATVNTDTPQQLASDQATIDADEANLVVAQQNLSDAVLSAPISGTVAAVNLTPNQTVTAGSTSAAITIISSGTYEANATLTTTQVSELTQGDAAQITINGVTGTFDGTVTRIGPVQESNGNYTYPLVIAMDTGGQQFPSGADAQLTVDLHSVSNAVVVPTSAVHTNGSTSYVLILKGGSQQEQRVTVGVVGAQYTQITSGLTNGATVILANLSTKVPSSNTNTSNNVGGFGGTGAGGAFRAFTGGGGFVGRGGGGGGGG